MRTWPTVSVEYHLAVRHAVRQSNAAFRILGTKNFCASILINQLRPEGLSLASGRCKDFDVGARVAAGRRASRQTRKFANVV
jgi:predicted membrane GTPase involved in stress response